MVSHTLAEAKSILNDSREDSFHELSGGVAFPIAGLIVWLGLGVWGYFTDPYGWVMAAYVATGALAPPPRARHRQANPHGLL